ncbi:helix-turn-helix domain-containing protein [Salinibacter grassmerensis]|uniref:helix-turn-helix domain-containing protein n=1 Tax=Salinibacter grassmerensis TaxID=3040353 RepID=UPI0021E85538|nr:helix-turn-helix domain-containing protein [Salinibacter grassmerensis]
MGSSQLLVGTLSITPSPLQTTRKQQISHPDEWTRPDTPVRVSNPPGLEQLLRTLVGLFAGADRHRDALIDLNVSEFVVRMLQTEARMERAQELLRDPGRTVTAVSYDLGFDSVSHFIKTFRKHVGDTLKTYQDRVADT